MNKKILLLGSFILILFLLFFKKEEIIETARLVKGDGETVASIVKKLEPIILNKLSTDFKKKGFQSLPDKIMLLAFKEERQLIVFGKKGDDWEEIKIYPFTAFSGQLGPKLKEGDRQIPEGLYQINFLNPNSAYHLSMKVNYPNAFDQQKAAEEERTNLGGDIFIHGKEVTIGCIPIGDEAIEELFFLAAKTIEQGIEIIISPRDFRVNPSFPEIKSVSWERELYSLIVERLKEI